MSMMPPPSAPPAPTAAPATTPSIMCPQCGCPISLMAAPAEPEAPPMEEMESPDMQAGEAAEGAEMPEDAVAAGYMDKMPPARKGDPKKAGALMREWK